MRRTHYATAECAETSQKTRIGSMELGRDVRESPAVGGGALAPAFPVVATGNIRGAAIACRHFLSAEHTTDSGSSHNRAVGNLPPLVRPPVSTTRPSRLLDVRLRL